MNRQEIIAVRIPCIQRVQALGRFLISLALLVANRRNAQRNVESTKYLAIVQQVQLAVFLFDTILSATGKSLACAGNANRLRPASNVAVRLVTADRLFKILDILQVSSRLANHARPENGPVHANHFHSHISPGNPAYGEAYRPGTDSVGRQEAEQFLWINGIVKHAAKIHRVPVVKIQGQSQRRYGKACGA